MNSVEIVETCRPGKRVRWFRLKRKAAYFSFASVILAIILGIIAGYRPFGVGADFPNYEIFYHGIRDEAFYKAARFEVGFKFLAYYARNALGLSVMGFLAILSTISLIVKFNVLGQLKHPWAAIFFYVLAWYPLYENTQIRAAIAVAFLFCALKALFEASWMRYALISCGAILFHDSAIFAIVMLVVAKYISRLPRFFWVVSPIVAGALMYGFVSVLLPYFLVFRPNLLDGIDQSEAPNLFSGVNILTFLFLIAAFFSGSLDGRQSKTFFVVVGFSFAALVGFQGIPVLANRLREILFVFMTFIAFDYRLSFRTLPQATIALALVFWSVYRAILNGLFSG